MTGLSRALTSQELALVTFLAFLGPARREALVDALWDGQPVSNGRLANLVSAVRSLLGRHHLPEARSGRYRLVAIRTDLDLLVELAAPSRLGQVPRRPVEEITALQAAIGLVRGPVFGGPAGRHWRWLDDHPEVSARAEAVVADAANRLVALLRQGGEPDRARAMCERVLRYSPLDRDLVLALESLHREQGRPAAAHRLMERWRLRVLHLTGADPLIVDQAPSRSAVTTTLPR